MLMLTAMLLLSAGTDDDTNTASNATTSIVCLTMQESIELPFRADMQIRM